MKKLTYFKILINTLIMIILLILALSANAFEITFKNECRQDTKFWVFERGATPQAAPKLLHEVEITKGTSLMIDVDIEKPTVLAVFWIVRYEQNLQQPWLAFWVHENFISMKVRLVAGRFVPKDLIEVEKGILH